MINLLLSALSSLILGIGWGYISLIFLRKIKAKQSILKYVDNHKDKEGTPTMGGVIFLLPATVVTLIFAGVKSQFSIIAVCIMLGYGLIGFLDDFIKIKGCNNQGLKAYQKIIFQAGVAIIITAYAYMSDYIGSSIAIPFTDIIINLGWGYIPLCFILYIATTNSVNLTDGLDGLAGNTSAVTLTVLGVVAGTMWHGYQNSGEVLLASEMYSLTIFCLALVGGLLAFLWFNTHPAKVFMGDTGSLALGGSIATVAIFIGNPLIILLVGIMYVVSSISVIVQVIYFKITKGKRVFLMAPFHHHLQYKGINETSIVGMYTIITIAMGIITLLSI